jgi:hypothetical protein
MNSTYKSATVDVRGGEISPPVLRSFAYVRKSDFILGALLALVLPCVVAAEEPPPLDQVAAPKLPEAKSPTLREGVEEALGVNVRGEFSNKYRARASHGSAFDKESDQDFIQNLRFTAGDEAAGAWTFDFAGRLSEDIDGNLHTSGFFPFDELSNSYSDRVNGRVYSAVVTGRDVAGLDRVRVGRQELTEGIPLAFDGARLDTPEVASLARLQVTVFGGVPTHLYESSPSGDWLAGAGVAVRPHTTARVSAQAAHIVDEFSLYGHRRTNVETLRWQQQLSRRLSAEARATVIDSRGREAGLSAAWRDPERDLHLQAGFKRLMEEQKSYALDVDPYAGLLTSQQPYNQWDARASKAFTSWLTLNADGSVRLLQNERDEGDFNREFSRFAIVPVLAGLPAQGTDWTLTVTAWEADNTHLLSYGGEMAQQVAEGVSARIGTDYALYKFDLFADRERTQARTHYVKIRWQQTKAIRWDLGFERERSDFDTLSKLEFSVRYRF